MNLKSLIIASALSIGTLASAFDGKVVDKDTGTPLEGVSVVALSSDWKYLGACSTDSLGQFKINVTAPPIAKFTFIGYGEMVIGTDGEDSVGVIEMQQSTNQLGEVTVTSVQPETRLSHTSFITTISNTFLSKLSTAEAVLNWVPGVTAANGAVSVFNKPNTLIYINSRKSSLSELKSVDPSNIASIEVIPTPGAKYSSEVGAVIIVHTIKRVSDYLGGSLYSNSEFARHYSNGENLNILYQSNGWDINASGSFQMSNIYVEPHEKTTSSVSQPWVLDQVSRMEVKPRSGSALLSVNYEISKTQSVGLKYSFSMTKQRQYGTSISARTQDDNLVESFTSLGNLTGNGAPTHYINGYYAGTFGRLALDFNCDWSTSNSRLNNDDHEFDELNGYDYLVSTITHTKTNFIAEQLNATLTFNRLQLLAGESVSHSKHDTSFSNLEQIYSANNGKTVETDVAAYAEVRYAILSNLNASAGLRYEHSDVDYTNVNGGQISALNNKLNDFYPKATLSGSLNKFNWVLSYQYRRVRPTYGQLSSSLLYVDPFTFEQGNPLLKPSKYHDVEFYGQWKQWWARVDYATTDNSIVSWYEPYENSATVLLKTYQNLANRKRAAVMVGCNHKVKCWYLQGNIVLLRQWTDMPINGVMSNFNSNVFELHLRNNFTLPYRMSLRVNYDFATNGKYINMQRDASHSLYVAFAKLFLSDALNVEVYVSDLLNKASVRTVAYMNYIQQESLMLGDRRRFGISLSWRFHTRPSHYKGAGAATEERSRL